ncbi:MAG: GNAT family N-acetyltransferase [Burkholderiales bacterium]
MLEVLLPITIRASCDSDDVCSVHRAAFSTETEALLVNQLQARGKSVVSLVAECGSDIVGHILFSPVTIDEKPVNGVGLAPIAVLPEMQNRGIGGRLIAAGLAACQRTGIGFVVVLGDPGFYERFGFTPASGRGLRNEYGAESEFAAIELSPQSIPSKGGLVKYAPEFAGLVFDRG